MPVFVRAQVMGTDMGTGSTPVDMHFYIDEVDTYIHRQTIHRLVRVRVPAYILRCYLLLITGGTRANVLIAQTNYYRHIYANCRIF